MPADPNDACCLYWIRDDNCDDPSVHGYIGLTKNIESRWYNHRRSGNFPPSATIEILYEGSRAECAKRERHYRPSANVGWNRSNGGGRWRKAPNPLDSAV
jgi:hypothetical protein